MNTIYANSVGEWASASRAVESGSSDAPKRIAFPNLYDPAEYIDITDALEDAAPEVRSGHDLILPVINIGRAALDRIVVLPPVVADIAYMADDIGGKKYRAGMYRFSRLDRASGIVDFGWHSDGENPGALPFNHLTVEGAAEADFLRIEDRARAAQFLGAEARNARFSEGELEAVETISLQPATLVTFQGVHDPEKPRHQDLHNFKTTERPRKSFLLKSRPTNRKGLEILEELIEVVPALTAYHPEEVQARTSRHY